MRETAGDAPRRQPRPTPARDRLRAAVGRRRRGRGAVRRRLPRLAGGGRRRLDGRRRDRGRGATAADRRSAGRRDGRDRARAGSAPIGDATGGPAGPAIGTRPRTGSRPVRDSAAARPGDPRRRSCRRRPIAARRRRSTPSSPGSACARATSSWRWAIRRSPPTSSSCAGSRASWPTSRPRSRPPRRPGSSSRSARREPSRDPRRPARDRDRTAGPDRADRADRLRQVDGRRRGSRRAGRDRHRRRPARPRGDRARASRRWPRSSAGSGPSVLGAGRIARPGGARPARLRRPRRAPRARGDHPSGDPAAGLLAALDAAAGTGAPAVVLEAIRLVEGGYVDLLDEVWLVACDPAAQRARLADRGLAPAEAERRIARQAGLVERVRPIATRTLDTSGDLGRDLEAADRGARGRAGPAARPPRAAGYGVAAG